MATRISEDYAGQNLKD